MDEQPPSLRQTPSRWRAKLEEETAKTPEHAIPKAVTDALEDEALRLQRHYMGDFPHRRPSDIRRSIERLAGQLRKAADTLERLGPPGLLLILVQDPANRGIDDLDPAAHIAYLRHLADLAHAARETAAEEAVSRLDHLGGQPRPVELDLLVVGLRNLFEHHLGLRALSRPHDLELEEPTVFEHFVLEIVQRNSRIPGEPDAARIRAAIHAAVRRPARSPLEPPKGV